MKSEIPISFIYCKNYCDNIYNFHFNLHLSYFDISAHTRKLNISRLYRHTNEKLKQLRGPKLASKSEIEYTISANELLTYHLLGTLFKII